MKIYSCTNFRGFNPVGTCAIIIAPTIEIAQTKLETRLAHYGLPQERHWIPELHEISTGIAGVYILNDGEY